MSWTAKKSFKSGRRSRNPRHRRLAIEGLEPRLVLTWAAIPPAQITPPLNPIAITLDSQGDADGTGSVVSNEVDYFKFTPAATGLYDVSTGTPTSSLDTVIGVFTASGARLAFSDDITYAVNTDSHLTVNLASGEEYYLGVTNYSALSRGGYEWAIDGPSGTSTPGADDSYEENDAQTQAADLGALTAAKTFSGLVMADGADWFRFSTSVTGVAASNVSIAFQNAQGDLQLQLYNAAGTLIGTSQGTADSETLSLTGRAAGTYYVRVYGADNPSYSLTVSPPVVAPPPAGGFQITLDMHGLTTSQQAIFELAASRWAQVITGDLPNATYKGTTVDDVLIDASGANIDGTGGILGQAGPDSFRSGSSLPYHGIMQFDSADMASMERSGLLLGVVLHEMGHVLGIGTIWQRLGLLSGAGTSNPIFTGTNARDAYNTLANKTAAGVPVEAGGGPGTALAHWRESTFGSELMTGYAGPGVILPLSSITVGSLKDLGYAVDMTAADSFTIPGISAAALESPRSIASRRPAFNVETTPAKVGAIQSTMVASAQVSSHAHPSLAASSDAAAWIPAAALSSSSAMSKQSSRVSARDVYLASFLPTQTRAAVASNAWYSYSASDSSDSAGVASADDATEQAWADWDSCAAQV